jgi:hypothetical protein
MAETRRRNKTKARHGQTMTGKIQLKSLIVGTLLVEVPILAWVARLLSETARFLVLRNRAAVTLS